MQQLVILWQLDRTADGKIVSVMPTPTGVMVQKGIDLKVGDEEGRQVRLRRLRAAELRSRPARSTKRLIKTIVASQEMMVTIHAKDGRDVHFKFPMTGIDKAMAAVRS